MAILTQDVKDKALEVYDAVIEVAKARELLDLGAGLADHPVVKALPAPIGPIVQLAALSFNIFVKSMVFTVAFFMAGTVLTQALFQALITAASNRAIAPTAVWWLDLVEKTRQESTPGINNVILAAMSEMFGVEFDKFDLPTGTDRRAVEERARTIGTKIRSLLEREFTQGGPLSRAQGEKAADMFTGFSVNFAIASAFISLVGEVMTGGQVEAFRELGVELADTLGLGRMARGGLREMVNTVVATPFEWHMNAKYRPTRPGATQLVEAFFKQKLTEDELRTYLADYGYSDQFIDILVANAQKVMGDADLSRLIRHGQVTRPEALDELRAAGWDDRRAQLALDSNEFLRVDARIEEFINRLQTATIAGNISIQDYFRAVDNLPLFEREKSWLKRSLGELFEHPRKAITLSQLEDMLVEGLSTVEELDDYLAADGYSELHRSQLKQLIIIRVQRELEARRKKAEKEARPPEVRLSLGQLRQAFIDGIIDLTEWETRVTELGYDADELHILTLQVLLDQAEATERRRLAEERERRRREKEEAAAQQPPSP